MGEVTQLIVQARAGDRGALDRLFALLYPELREIAHRRLAPHQRGGLLDTTALVNECYLRFVQRDGLRPEDRAHFLAVASRVMRHLLVDYAYKRKTLKRGGDRQRVAFDEERLLPDTEVERFLDLDEALKQLEAKHPRPARAIEHSYFGGLTNEESASVLGISRATVERDLRFARVWLARILGSPPEHG